MPTPPISPIRLGVVGLGLIWGVHRDVLKRLPESFAITALCARNPERRAAAADFPAARLFSDYQALVAAPEVDAVVVLTPIALNAPVALAALRAGKDVYVEKPLADSLAAAQAVAAAAQACGRQVRVLEQFLSAPQWQDLAAIIASGEIGDLAMWDRTAHHYIGSERDPWGFGAITWRRDGQVPLGPLWDGGIHEIAVHQRLFGQPATVLATARTLRHEHGPYDLINMQFTYRSGLSGMFSHSGYLGGRRNHFHLRGTRGLIAIEGDQLHIEEKFGDRARTQTVAVVDQHLAMWTGFAAGTTAYTIDDALRDIATLDAVQRSIASGRPVELGAPLGATSASSSR
jgi:predicted dehydrogenase